MTPARAGFRSMDIAHVLPWKMAHKREQPAPEVEVEPTADHDDKGPVKSHPNDSDNETASAASSDKDTPTPLPSGGVASSFARAGKLFWSSNPLAALRKQHARTVSDFSDSDFTPFTPGTPVWTRYGLGTIVTTRVDDGFLIVNLQNMSRMTLYLNPADEDYYSVPAIRYDWVETPAGEGRVLSFNPKTQMYCVHVGGDSGARIDADVNVHRNDLRRVMPVRRQTHAFVGLHQPQQHAQPHPHEQSALSKGLNSAIKSIVTTSSGISTSTYQFVSNYYYHGQCVVTTFGPGTIVTLDQTHHRVQVQLTWGAMAYLSTDAILHYAKALVGMEVTTKYGGGVVTELRLRDSMYGVKLHTPKEGEDEHVYVHESGVVRGAGRRLRLGSAQKQVKEKLGASTNKLLSFAQTKVKLFSQGSGKVSDTEAASTSRRSRSSSGSRWSGRLSGSKQTPSRSKSTRVVEDEEEPSSAGI